jgi:cell division septation protein DedD
MDCFSRIDYVLARETRLAHMSQIFDTLKTIRTEREAAVREYTRVAARTGDPAAMMPAPVPRRWRTGIVGGLLGFIAGVVVTLAVVLPRVLPVPERPAGVVDVAVEREMPPSRPAPDAGMAAPAAMAMAALVADPPQASAGPDVPVSDDAAIAKNPVVAAADEPVQAAPPADDFWVQVGAFKDHDNADHLRARLVTERRSAAIRPGRPGALPWVLAVGPYADERAADEARTALARQGFPGFVVRGDR